MRAGPRGGRGKWASGARLISSAGPLRIEALQRARRFVVGALRILDRLRSLFGLRGDLSRVLSRRVGFSGRLLQTLFRLGLFLFSLLRARGGLLQRLLGLLLVLARLAQRALGFLHCRSGGGELRLALLGRAPRVFLRRRLLLRRLWRPGGVLERNDAAGTGADHRFADPRDEGRERLEPRRIDVVRQAPAARRVGKRAIGRKRFQRRGDPSHRVRSRVAARLLQHGGRKLGQLRQRRAPRFERAPDIGGLAGKVRRLRLPEALARCNQPVERVALAVIELVDGPCRQRGLGQRLDLLGFVFVPRFFQPSGKRVTRRRKLRERELKQRIEVIFDR